MTNTAMATAIGYAFVFCWCCLGCDKPKAATRPSQAATQPLGLVVPICFYGKVVDEAGQGVSDATVGYYVSAQAPGEKSPPYDQRPPIRQVRTGPDGRFEIRGETGTGLGIQSITKPGLEWLQEYGADQRRAQEPHSGNSGFYYGNASEMIRYTPDPNNPAIFPLYPINSNVDGKLSRGGWDLYPDGRKVRNGLVRPFWPSVGPRARVLRQYLRDPRVSREDLTFVRRLWGAAEDRAATQPATDSATAPAQPATQLDFYGRVVDDRGQGLAGARVVFRVYPLTLEPPRDLGWAFAEETFTNASGGFQIHRRAGSRLEIVWIELSGRPGDWIRENDTIDLRRDDGGIVQNTVYSYSCDGSHGYVPDPNFPAVFPHHPPGCQTESQISRGGADILPDGRRIRNHPTYPFFPTAGPRAARIIKEVNWQGDYASQLRKLRMEVQAQEE